MFFRSKPTRYTMGNLPKGVFKTYAKVALSEARVLTEADFAERLGVIKTKEGPAKFEVGDYLNRGVEGEEWPITREKMLATKIAVSELDAEGWQKWRNTNTVRATQVGHIFEVVRSNGEVLSGKAGDMFVEDGSSCRIVDREIFRKSYGEV